MVVSKNLKTVHIRGRAMACALGDDIPKIVSNIREKKVRTVSVPLSLLDSKENRPYYLLDGHAKRDPAKLDSYFYGVLFDTISKALADAELGKTEIRDMPILFGSTCMDIPIYEGYYENSDVEYADIFAKTSAGYGNIADKIAEHFQIGGACYTFNTACTSSANALMSGRDMILAGSAQRALIVGYDLYSNMGFYGFESLKLLSHSAYKPFDKNRDGIILGEGCGAIVLDTTAKNSDAFRIAGAANSCDISNVAVHDETGDSILRMMRSALENAGMSPDRIAGVKAHATGTHQNDLAECNALRKLFGENIPPVTGLKPYLGHTVGAGGAVELTAFTESVKTGFFPATAGFKDVDPELNLAPVSENLPAKKGAFLLNFFGFGGNSTALVISNEEVENG